MNNTVRATEEVVLTMLYRSQDPCREVDKVQVPRWREMVSAPQGHAKLDATPHLGSDSFSKIKEAKLVNSVIFSFPIQLLPKCRNGSHQPSRTPMRSLDGPLVTGLHPHPRRGSVSRQSRPRLKAPRPRRHGSQRQRSRRRFPRRRSRLLSRQMTP